MDTIILIVIFITISAYIVVFYLGFEIPLKRASLNWPVTNGIITKTDIIFDIEYIDFGARVFYTYNIEGHEYSDNRYQVGSDVPYRCRTRKKAECYLQDYPVGSNIKIIYNPVEPEYGARSHGLLFMKNNIH